MKIPTGQLINGTWREGSGQGFASFDPAGAGEIWRGREAGEEEIQAAVEAAASAQPGWARRSLDERRSVLQRFAEILKENAEGLAELISRETGKPLWESIAEVAAMAAKVDLSHQAYAQRCGRSGTQNGTVHRELRFRPQGVAAVFGPFNFPGHLPNGHIVPALLAGNAVVFKPSEFTPATGARLAELYVEAGVPEGVIHLIQGGRGAGEALLDQPRINAVFFTGSWKAGSAIHARFAGRTEVILALEMGGNNPLVVHDVRQLSAALPHILLSAFSTSGQRCTCARRLILVDGDESRRLMEQLLLLVPRIRVDFWDKKPEPFMGPLIHGKSAKAVLAAQQVRQKAGGEILVPCQAVDGHPCLITPGVMDVTGVKELPDEEVFGPFLQVRRVKDFDAAVAEANRTAFGLSAGLISDDKELFDRFQREVRAGIVNWNRPTTGASSAAPFGGAGRSGNHRPGAFFAADYCAYPVASHIDDAVRLPEKPVPGLPMG